MSVTTANKREIEVLGASLFAPVPAGKLYEALLDVRGFPGWAPGVRRVEVLDAPGLGGWSPSGRSPFSGRGAR